jgi:predicted DNA binding protein
VRLPSSTWLYYVTVTHPDCRVEVLDRLLLTPRSMLSEVRIHGNRIHEMIREVERFPSVKQVELLEEDGSSGLVRVTHRAPEFIGVFQRLRILRRFPFWVSNGAATWVVVGSGAKIRQLVDGLSRSVPEVRIETIRRVEPRSSSPLLTRREAELFRRAMHEGYFDVPRRISLTALAERVNLAKSTLSRALAVVERKLLSDSNTVGAGSAPGAAVTEPVR